MIHRAVGFMFQPRKQWQAIAQFEDKQFLPYLLYPAILGLIPVLSWYVGTTQVGWSVGGETTRLTTNSATAIAVLFFLAQLMAIWIIGYFIHWMSHTYGVNSSPVKGMALAGFMATPILVAGIIGLAPNFAIDMLVGVAAVSYSVYLLYIGIPIVFNMPAERGFLYASAMVGVALVIVICVMCGSVILWDMGFAPEFTD